MLRALLQQRRAFRQRIDRDATDLLIWLGEGAYAEARAHMRAARRRADAADERLWCAVEIAKRSGIDIGKRGRWKWPDADRIASAQLAPTVRQIVRPNGREISDRLVEISRGIADISAGRADATQIHNIGAEAQQILDFTGRTPDLEQAVGELIAACEGVVIAPTMQELSQGTYQTTVEAAGRALLRLKAIALPT